MGEYYEPGVDVRLGCYNSSDKVGYNSLYKNMLFYYYPHMTGMIKFWGK
jgi:hypothetical protein